MPWEEKDGELNWVFDEDEEREARLQRIQERAEAAAIHNAGLSGGARITGCDCSWAGGGSNCGEPDGSRCFGTCCAAAAPATPTGAATGLSQGTSTAFNVARYGGDSAATSLDILPTARYHEVGPKVSPASAAVSGATHAGWAVEDGKGSVGHSGEFRLTGDSRAYLVSDYRVGSWEQHQYVRFDMHTQSLSFDIDLSKVPCGCLACVCTLRACGSNPHPWIAHLPAASPLRAFPPPPPPMRADLVAMPEPSAGHSNYCDLAENLGQLQPRSNPHTRAPARVGSVAPRHALGMPSTTHDRTQHYMPQGSR